MNFYTLNLSGYLSDYIRAVFSFNPVYTPLRGIASDNGFSTEQLAIPEQTHSSVITCIDAPGDYMSTDGLITDNPGIILTLQVADCVPIYLASSEIIGLVHSGWRGTTGGIVYTAVKKMMEMGVNNNEVRVFLGPAIGICCYEVDEEVANNFNKKAKKKSGNEKWKVGLHEQICEQLMECGISSSNIHTSDICSFEFWARNVYA